MIFVHVPPTKRGIVMRNIFFVIFILLAGCTATQQQYALDTSKIAVESSILKTQYAEVEAQIRAKREVFSDAEWRSLLNVDATIDMLIVKYDAMLKLDASSISLADIKFMWDLSATGYDQARTVLVAHWDEFAPSTQIMLNSFDRQANDLSTQISGLLDNPTNDKISQALVLITGTLSLAVKMLSIGATVL